MKSLMWSFLSLLVPVVAGAGELPVTVAPTAPAPAPVAQPEAKTPAVPKLADVGAAKVKALVNPSREDLKFEEVPWRTTLWSAVKEAQAADKPILLWAMNGHPLGCV